MSMDEAKNLAVLLKGGALPVNLKPAEDPQCEPDFGERIYLQELECRTVGVRACAVVYAVLL